MRRPFVAAGLSLLLGSLVLVWLGLTRGLHGHSVLVMPVAAGLFGAALVAMGLRAERGPATPASGRPAFVLVDLEVLDADMYKEYRGQAAGTVHLHGGRYIVRGGTNETLEGPWRPHRLVILQFPSMDAARGWYRSPEYQAITALRQKASRGSLVLVEGLDPAAPTPA